MNTFFDRRILQVGGTASSVSILSSVVVRQLSKTVFGSRWSHCLASDDDVVIDSPERGTPPLLHWAMHIALVIACASVTLACVPRSSQAAEEEWCRSKPDVVVYLPKGEKHHDGDNEMLLVFPAPKSDELLAMWTQSSVEGRGDNRLMLARTRDGVKWSEPVKIAGATPGTDESQASWGVPIVARSGRIFVFYVRERKASSVDRQISGVLGILYSDDNGQTWKTGPDLAMSRNRFDDPDKDTPKKFWLWTFAVRDRKGKWLLGYTQLTSAKVKPKPAREWPHADTRCSFVRFENLDDVSDLSKIKTTWLPTDREGLEVANKMYPQISTAQEPSTVLLPDGRLMVVMRTFTGHPYYSVSDDDGATWREPEPLRYRDGGEEVNHPISPCPIFKLNDGRFLLLFHNNDGAVGLHSQWTKRWKRNEANYIRRPTFIAVGQFQAKAHQPVWFGKPKQILDTDGVIVGPKKTAEVGTYPSLTEWHGKRTLWYPDRKYFLLGKYLPDSLLGR